MSKIVYLLGAGASYGTRDKDNKKRILTGIPVVNEIKVELENLIDLLSSWSLIDKDMEDSKQRLVKDF